MTQQLFIGDISLSDGTIESVLLLESAARIEFRLWDGSKAIFRFKGVIGSRDRNAVGQELEALDTYELLPITMAKADPFIQEILEDRPEGRQAEITCYAFISSLTMRPILEIYAEEVESERTSAF
ncbi:hypothetical protein [Saccharibacillus sp. JS10]|uniref:hypothetical protein n=1 Tax=Saccharibacillus sp. JS10 TaxID=2950552 RepID=UPI002109C0FC|nr:hypothetical protein [Saccharibacillus sp. JS10]MCQ4085242.1 hypothetical protein [Saccharibacillus sp. JS10]